MRKYSVLIIEDDLTSIEILQKILKKHFTGIGSVVSATNLHQGLEAYTRKQPDLLLLDIEIGNETIFSFLETIAPTKSEVILISSHQHFGVRAVNDNIASYVLKPIEIPLLKKAIYKAIHNISQREAVRKKKQEQLEVDAAKKIAVQGIKEIELIATENIAYMEADGKYTRVHTQDNKSRLASRNIGSFEKELPSKKFFRTHNKYIVNVDHILKITKATNMQCVLENQKKVPVAKRRQEVFYKFLKLT